MEIRGPQPMHLSDPIQLGDAHNVVAQISLDRQGLEWLEGLCPHGDEFTKDLNRALRVLDEREAIAAEDPGLGVYIAFGGELRP